MERTLAIRRESKFSASSFAEPALGTGTGREALFVSERTPGLGDERSDEVEFDVEFKPESESELEREVGSVSDADEGTVVTPNSPGRTCVISPGPLVPCGIA